MTTAANVILILLFLSGFFTVLGLACGAVELVQAKLGKPYQRRRTRKSLRRRAPRRALIKVRGGSGYDRCGKVGWDRG